MASTALDHQGRARVGDIELRAPGLSGSVVVTQGGGGGRVRGAASATGPLADAQRRNDMTTTHLVTVERPKRALGAAGGTRGPKASAATAMQLIVPGPPAGYEQVVLSTDEHGVKTWHFATKASKATGARGGRQTRTYVIKRRSADLPAPTVPAATRGAIPGLSKIVEVITFPIAAGAAAGIDFAVREWDRKKHAPRLRILRDTGQFEDLTDDDWTALSAGSALLLVHGTFSTTEGAFGALSKDTIAKLRQRYEGRVIAFDHPTIADTPFDNASRFFELVKGRHLELDIVCHSRGGLVSRSIAERPKGVDGPTDSVTVNSIVFVGATNAGTILADADHWNQLIDRMTTILSLVPVPGGADILESVLALVRSIAIRTIDGLVGLVAMAPSGKFLKDINDHVTAPGASRYFAIVSNFEPKDPGLRAWLNDGIRDKIFKDQPNDMMVAIASTCGDDLATRFPIRADARMSFPPERAIEHADYFGQPETSEALLRWLTPSPALVGAPGR